MLADYRTLPETGPLTPDWYFAIASFIRLLTLFIHFINPHIFVPFIITRCGMGEGKTSVDLYMNGLRYWAFFVFLASYLLFICGNFFFSFAYYFDFIRIMSLNLHSF